jgi:hypothetical protein
MPAKSTRAILIRYGKPPESIEVVGREGKRWRTSRGILLDESENTRVYVYSPELEAEFARLYRQYRNALDAWYEQRHSAPLLEPA